MRKLENFHLLVMLILLVAVGQMAQTIYVPSIPDMGRDLGVRSDAIQSVMAAYLLTYGASQLIYGPLSDRIGRRPVILAGMGIFMLGALLALLAPSLHVLVMAAALQDGDRRCRGDGPYHAARSVQRHCAALRQ